MTTFDLNDAAFSALVSKSIIDALTPEKRDELITQALENFINKPDPHGYGSDKRTPLEKATEMAMHQTVRKHIEGMLDENGAFREQVHSAVEAAILKAFSDEQRRRDMIDNMAGAVCAAFKVDRY